MNNFYKGFYFISKFFNIIHIFKLKHSSKSNGASWRETNDQETDNKNMNLIAIDINALFTRRKSQPY